MIFFPIILTVARRFGGSLILYGLPAVTAFAATHAVLIPHPGPVAAVELLEGNLGVTMLAGIPVTVLAWLIGGYAVSKHIGRRIHVDIPTAVLGEVNDLTKPDGTKTKAPSFGLVLTLLLLPLLLISLNTVLNTLITGGVIAPDAAWARTLMLIGLTPVALLITVIVTLFALSPGRFSLAEGQKLMDSALGPICAVILITGAGGMFGSVLRASGIGEALTSSLSGLGMPLILQAFLIALALRIAQGSATVALTRTGGLLAADVTAANLSDLKVAALVFAIAAGASAMSHVNDSGFWLVGRFFEMDVATTLKTWTVTGTTLGLATFAVSWLMWLVV